MNQSLLKLSDLKIEKSELGQVISLRNKKRLIFNIFVKENFDDKIYTKNIETTIETLKDAMDQLKLKTFSMSREGNGFDKLPWNTLESIFKVYFGKGDYIITICSGEIEIPPENERVQIIKESHDSNVGGHKGETKTLQRVRERFYWRGMKDDVIKYVKTCDLCQKKKLVRIKTKLPMCLTDTPSKV